MGKGFWNGYGITIGNYNLVKLQFFKSVGKERIYHIIQNFFSQIIIQGFKMKI